MKPLFLVAAPVLCAALGFGMGEVLKPKDPSELPEILQSAPETHEVEEVEHAEDDDHSEEGEETLALVPLGSMSFPIYKPEGVTYVVAAFSVELKDAAQVEAFVAPNHQARIRDTILKSLKESAHTFAGSHTGPDAETLSGLVHHDLTQRYVNIASVVVDGVYDIKVPRGEKPLPPGKS